MLSFENDYIAGAHPKILERLLETNMELLPGYGTDPYSEHAKEKIRKACHLPQADVHFLTGGTQTNATVISTLLHDYEGVIAADSGHISVHEAGAIEYTGHKVLTIPAVEGKLEAGGLREFLESFYADENHAHMVYPGMVYISWPTEMGTLYSKAELTAIAEICRQYRILLYLDGARLGYGLMSEACDLTLPELAEHCDVFTIGGTKVGALCGEAVVFKKPVPCFLTSVKKRGALLAKGRLTGIQFDTLFTDGLYFEISAHAIQMADKMKEIFYAAGLQFFLDSPTNQQFLILDNSLLKRLQEELVFSFWESYDAEHTVVRFVTSWSTDEEDLRQLKRILDAAVGTADGSA